MSNKNEEITLSMNMLLNGKDFFESLTTLMIKINGKKYRFEKAKWR